LELYLSGLGKHFPNELESSIIEKVFEKKTKKKGVLNFAGRALPYFVTQDDESLHFLSYYDLGTLAS
jgi:hypothetical protein